MKKRIAVFLLVLFTLAVFAPLPAQASMTSCDQFVSNVVVGSYHSVSDAFACAASDFGRFLDIIGTYDPNQDPAVVTVKEDLLSQWVGKGATPTDTVASLLKKRPVAAVASEA